MKIRAAVVVSSSGGKTVEKKISFESPVSCVTLDVMSVKTMQ